MFLPVCAGFCGIWLQVRVCFCLASQSMATLKGTQVSASECGSLVAAVGPGRLSLSILALNWPQALCRLPSAGEHGWEQAIRGRDHPEWADPVVVYLGGLRRDGDGLVSSSWPEGGETDHMRTRQVLEHFY